jgi:hypothetical protein
VPTKRNPEIESAKGKSGGDSAGRGGMNPEPRPHKYDAPGLSPRAFLLAVKRDPTVALEHRIDAAVKVVPLLDAFDFPDPDLRDSGLTYKIEGLLQ